MLCSGWMRWRSIEVAFYLVTKLQLSEIGKLELARPLGIGGQGNRGTQYIIHALITDHRINTPAVSSWCCDHLLNLSQEHHTPPS